MVVLLFVIIVNLGIGVVSRIFVENFLGLIDVYIDMVLFKVLVFGVNILVIGLVVGKMIC